jgi:hypothetical protein
MEERIAASATAEARFQVGQTAHFVDRFIAGDFL